MIALWALLVMVWLLVVPGPAPAGSTVVVLRSEPSLHQAGWVGQWQLDCCVQTLRTIGLTPVVADAAHLARVHASLLVLASPRCMGKAEVSAVRAFHARGGAILATYLASYRDENNQVVGPHNDFQLADLFGCDVYSWASGGGVCARLGSMELGRNTAMLVRAAPGAQVLARWANQDGRPPPEDAAVVQSGRVIYVGEDLFAPDNCHSGEVKRYVASLVDRLGAHRRPLAGWDRTVVDLDVPYPTDAPAPPASGPLIRVGLDGTPALSTWHVAVAGKDLEVLRGGRWVLVPRVSLTGLTDIRYVHTMLESPGLAGYGATPFRAASPITIEPLDHPWVVVVSRHANGTGALRAFRGRLEVRGSEAGLSLVNVLPLESYTAGVVPNEMGPLFPPAALQAMSVVARTFGLSHLHRHEADGYDVCNTVHCQVYGGMLSEWVTTNQAVALTEGQVAWAGDKPADTTFHACCGGVGDAVQNVWDEPPQPYLVGDSDGPAPVPDLSTEAVFRTFIDHPPPSYCDTAARFRWTATFTWTDLDHVFRQSLPQNIGHVQALNVLQRSSAGRIQTLQIVGSDSTVEVHRDAIRWLWSGGHVGTGGLQSTLFYIESTPAGVTLHGGGWGHGVGMCQEGAGGMARAGLDYRTILLHYYPGVAIHP